MHGCEPDLTMSAPLLWVVLDSSGVKLLHGLCALSVNEEGSSHLPTAEVWGPGGPAFEGELLETCSMAACSSFGYSFSR